MKKEKVKCIPEWVKGLLEEHEDIFREMIPEDSPDANIGLVDPTAQHTIPLIDGAVPVKMRPYAMSAAEMEILQIILQDLIEKGYIEEKPGFSNWSAPIMLLRK